MLIDTRTTFAWGVALPGIAGSAGTAKIGDAIDLSVASNMGEGYPMYLVILVGTPFAGGTSAAFNLVTADNEALSSNPVTLLSTGAIVTANLDAAGDTAVVVALPKANYKSWLGLTVTEVGDFTAGTIRAFLTVDPPAWRAYPEGNN